MTKKNYHQKKRKTFLSFSSSKKKNFSSPGKILDKQRKETKRYKQVDKQLLVALFILLALGLIFLFSASLINAHSNQSDAYHYLRKQAYFLLIGIPLLFIFIRINYHSFRKFSLFFLIFSFFLLILVFIPGFSVKGKGSFTSYSWIVIFGFSFQVAELVKLFLIFYLAAWVESRKEDLKKFSTGLLPFLVVIFAIGLLLLLQPDFGTFLLVFIIALAIYFVAGGNMKQLIVLFVLLSLMGSYFFFKSTRSLPEEGGSGSQKIIHSYQLNRIRCLQDPNFDKDHCYQVNQSLIAVGSGGLWGRGLGNSLQKHNYLPEVWADSIFPVIAEEIGFVGVVVLVLLYLFIFYRGMLIARNSLDIYGRSLAVGISVWIAIQAFLNIGGMINLVPMTGLPLPFISAGGTSIVIFLASFGILLNIGRQGEN